MHGLDELLEQLQRQLDEIEALRAVFPDLNDCAGGCDPPALLLAAPEQQALELAQQVCEAASQASGAPAGGLEVNGDADDWGPLAGLPLLSGTVRPPDVTYGGQPVALRFSLPRGYPGATCPPPGDEEQGEEHQAPGQADDRTAADGAPEAAPQGGGAAGGHCGEDAARGPADGPRCLTGATDNREAIASRLMVSGEARAYRHRRALLQVECAGPRHVHELLGRVVQAVAEREAEAGCECLLLAVDALKDAVDELAAGCGGPPGPSAADEDQAATSGGPGGGGEEEGPEGLLCCLVWLHHLKSLAKRKLILQWARELGLAGACKPGFPGVVVVEGHSSDVREFLARMRSLAWQALQVRGQDLAPLPAATQPQLPGGHHAGTGRLVAGGGGGTTSKAAGDGAVGHNNAAAVESMRRLRSPLPFCELDEAGGMSQLGALCRAAGLHHVFMTALKL